MVIGHSRGTVRNGGGSAALVSLADDDKLYCGAVMVFFSRRIIGWSIAARQDAALVLNALSMAVTRQQTEEG